MYCYINILIPYKIVSYIIRKFSILLSFATLTFLYNMLQTNIIRYFNNVSHCLLCTIHYYTNKKVSGRTIYLYGITNSLTRYKQTYLITKKYITYNYVFIVYLIL